MLFDSHAHMDVEEFAEDRDELLERIHADKISYVVNPGVDLETSTGAIELAQKLDIRRCGILSAGNVFYG